MKTNTKKLTLAGVLCAVAVVGSMFSFPVFGSKCAPVQHMVNILCAVLLGPWYGVAVALLCGLVYDRFRNLIPTLCAEVFGTGIIGGLLAWPVAVLLMGKPAGSIAFYAYVVPFLVSTIGGSLIAGAVLLTLEKNNALQRMQSSNTG